MHTAVSNSLDTPWCPIVCIGHCGVQTIGHHSGADYWTPVVSRLLDTNSVHTIGHRTVVSRLVCTLRCPIVWTHCGVQTSLHTVVSRLVCTPRCPIVCALWCPIVCRLLDTIVCTLLCPIVCTPWCPIVCTLRVQILDTVVCRLLDTAVSRLLDTGVK